MISHIRLSLFERAANLPAVSARELALMLCGLEPHLTTAAIPDDKHEYYDIFLHQLSDKSNLPDASLRAETRRLTRLMKCSRWHT